jgi:two-component system, LuxR family, response regulator FixJ
VTSAARESAPLIAIVDDEPEIAEALAELIPIVAGYRTLAFTSGAEFLLSLEMDRPDAIVLDLWMPPPDGLEILRQLQQRGLGVIPVVVITASSPAAVAGAIEAGAVDGLQKPFKVEKLVEKLRNVIEPKP